MHQIPYNLTRLISPSTFVTYRYKSYIGAGFWAIRRALSRFRTVLETERPFLDHFRHLGLKMRQCCLILDIHFTLDGKMFFFIKQKDERRCEKKQSEKREKQVINETGRNNDHKYIKYYGPCGHFYAIRSPICCLFVLNIMT